MSNTVKIKRGSGAPTTSEIAAYELAYDYTNNKLYIYDPTESSGQEIVEITGTDTNTTYTAGTNLTLDGTEFDVDDAFLINSGNDTTSGTITAAGFTTTGNLSLAGHAVNDIDIGSEFVDADDHLMTSGAIKEKIESYSYLTSVPNHSANLLTSGTVPLARISDLTTDNIASDAAIEASKIGVLPASKITSGTFAAARIPDSFLKNDADDTTSGTITAAGFTTAGTVTAGATSNQIRLRTVSNASPIADTFAGNTEQSYIDFLESTSTNDPGYIMHETRDEAETNEGVIHLCPSDDNADGDYISIHGTNDADSLKLHTSGKIEGVSTLTATSIVLGGHTMSDIDIGSEFVDTDDHLMTSGAIKEKIESYGYVTSAGDITGVTAGTGLSGGGSSGDVTLQLDGTYLKENGSWTGDLVSDHGWSRVFTYTNGGAVMSWITKNSQMSTLIDGSYFAYEAGSNQGGGFWSSTSSDYDNAPGIVASAAAELKVTTADGGDSNLLVTGTIRATGTNAFTIGNVADVARIQESSGSFSFLTTGNAYANIEADDITAAGKIIHYGDTDTHMNFSAADTWKVTCGGHNSLTAIANRVYVNAAGANGLLINNDEGQAADSARIFFEGTSTSAIMQQGTDLSFRTGATTGSSSGTERFYITNTGNCYATGALNVTSTITTNYGVAFTNGDTNFLFYNNTGDDLIYLRDTTNSKMIQTWYPNSTSITGGLVVNESGGDYDTRIEGDTDTNLVRVDAGNDRVGIGTGSPSYLLHVDGHAYAGSSWLGPDGSAATPTYRFHNDGDTGMYLSATGTIAFSTGGSGRMTIDSNGILYVSNKVQAGSAGIEIWDSTHGFRPVLVKDSTYTKLLNNDGTVMLYLGDTGDGNIYYQGGEHRFRNLAGDAYYLTVGSGHISGAGIDLHLRRTTNNDDMIEINASDTRIYGDADERMRIGSTVTIYKPTHINHQLYGGFGAQTTSGTTDWNDSTNARSGGGHTLLLEDATNGPTDSCVNSSNTTYMHPFSFEYASWNNDGNMTQFGIPYYFANNDGVRPAVRSRYSGTWSDWHSLITGNASGQIQGNQGSAGTPSYSFNGNGHSDLNTGIYSSGADSFNITTGGTERTQINSLGVKVVNGALGVNVTPNGTDGRIDAGNDVVAYSTSDKRLKENIKPLDNALDKVMQISGIEFDWKKLTEKEKETIHGNEGHDVGVIAQEVEEVLPEVVTQRDSGYKAVKYEKIVPLLIEAIKELKQQIQELKNG